MFALDPLTLERAERVSRNYFYAGFALLPWLWVLNAALFWRHRAASPVIAANVRRSIIGAAVAAVGFVAYVAAIHTCCPNASIWVIRPGRDYRQNGWFSDAVYNAKT